MQNWANVKKRYRTIVKACSRILRIYMRCIIVGYAMRGCRNIRRYFYWLNLDFLIVFLGNSRLFYSDTNRLWECKCLFQSWMLLWQYIRTGSSYLRLLNGPRDWFNEESELTSRKSIRAIRLMKFSYNQFY